MNIIPFQSKKIKYIEQINTNKNGKKEIKTELNSNKSNNIIQRKEFGIINIKPINKNSIMNEISNLDNKENKNYDSTCLTTGNEKKEEEILVIKEILKNQKIKNQILNKRLFSSLGKNNLNFHSKSLPKYNNKNIKKINEDKLNLNFSSDSKRFMTTKNRNRSTLIYKNSKVEKKTKNENNSNNEIKFSQKNLNISNNKNKRPKSNMIFRNKKYNFHNLFNEEILHSCTILTFNISSNWGNNTKITINSIKLINNENKIIPIEKGKIDINNPWSSKYSKSEIKKLNIYFLRKYILKSIEIFNGFNDSGIKNISIIQDGRYNIWKGIIPKINQLSNKIYKIEIEQNNFRNKKNLYINNKNLHIESSNSNEFLIKQNNNDLIDHFYEKTKRQLYTKIENINYEICNKLKIFFIDNYGNKNLIGLTGIELIDDKNKIIPLSKYINNINSNILNSKGEDFILDKKVIKNLINPKKEVNNQKYMFITYFKNAFVEISFSKILKIKKITFYNYNCPYFLDICTKELKLLFYKNNKLTHSYNKIFLIKPCGEEGIDYGQNIIFPFDSKIIPKEINNINIFNEKSILNNSYYSPFCPSGFIIKIFLLSTYGNKEYIGLNSIEILNDKGENIFLKGKTYFFPDKVLINPHNVIFGNYNNINKKLNDNIINRLIIMFDELEIIYCIKFFNYEKYKDIAVKEIKILIDEFIVYEGNIKNEGETIIAFNEMYLDKKTKKEKKYECKYEEIETHNAKILKLQNY